MLAEGAPACAAPCWRRGRPGTATSSWTAPWTASWSTPTARAVGPTAKVDLSWFPQVSSSRREHPGGDRSGRLAAVGVAGAPGPRARPDLRPRSPRAVDGFADWADEAHAVLADLGYIGEAGRLTCPIEKLAGPARLSTVQHTVSALHTATRAPAERGTSLLMTTYKALRGVSLYPWRIDAVAAASLVLLHPGTSRPNDQSITGKASLTPWTGNSAANWSHNGAINQDGRATRPRDLQMITRRRPLLTRRPVPPTSRRPRSRWRTGRRGPWPGG